MKFKPGESVKFKGLKVDQLVIQSVEGKLVLNDSNTTIKGVMTVEGDKQRMMFLPDGTIYCHPKFGKVLSKVRHLNVPKTTKKTKNRKTAQT